MRTFKAVVEYDGTAYHGWQVQKNLPTVQGAMEAALARILQAPTRVHGAGRTDSGVHAVGQVVHFPADWAHAPAKLQKGLNALLPPDIAVRGVEIAPDGFHARHSARAKTYVYTILNRAVPSPLHRLYCWHVPYSLDVSSMGRAAEHLLGSHDFATFGAPTDGTPSTVREILVARWDKVSPEDVLTFTVKGTGFLRYMVRSLVGSLVMVGTHKIGPGEFRSDLESCDRSRSGPTAPAAGLCLVHVEYDPS